MMAEMIPLVRVPRKVAPRGSPMARASSPTVSAPASPNSAGVSPLASIFSRARSVWGSLPTRSASYSFPSPVVTAALDWSLTTWAQVIMYPSRVRTMPVPEPLLSSFSTVMLTAEGAHFLYSAS